MLNTDVLPLNVHLNLKYTCFKAGGYALLTLYFLLYTYSSALKNTSKTDRVCLKWEINIAPTGGSRELTKQR